MVFLYDILPIKFLNEVGLGDDHQAPNLGLFEFLCEFNLFRVTEVIESVIRQLAVIRRIKEHKIITVVILVKDVFVVCIVNLRVPQQIDISRMGGVDICHILGIPIGHSNLSIFVVFDCSTEACL